MIEVVENLMKFIYKHSFFRNVCYFIFMSALLLGAFIFFLFASNGLDFRDFLNPAAYHQLMIKYKKIIITFFILEQIALVYLIIWQDRKLKKITNPAKEQIHIKDIAEIWTQYNATSAEKPMFETTTYNDRQNVTSVNETILSVAIFNHTETRLFVNDIVKPIHKKINSGHLKTIIMLLNLLEQNKDCPSVVNFAKNDPNVIYQDREYVTFDKKTKYDIYEAISVYRHSMNVARNAIEIMNKEKTSKINLIGKLVIVALAHDIGKIRRYEIREQKREISFEDKKRMPHQNLSAMILYENFKDCPDLKEIAECVERHHNGTIDKNDILLKILIEADSATRSNELHKYKLGEDICDLLNKPKAAKTQEVIAPQSTTPKPTPQPQVVQTNDNRLFSGNFSSEFNDKLYPKIAGLVLLGVGFEKDLVENDYKSLESLLEKDLQSSEISCYTKEKGFYVLINQQRDKSKVYNLAYDLTQRIAKSDFKSCFIGFVMSKEAQNATDMVEKANLALNEAITRKAIVDYKDIKNKENSELVTISDTQNTQNIENVGDKDETMQQTGQESSENPSKQGDENTENTDTSQETNENFSQANKDENTAQESKKDEEEEVVVNNIEVDTQATTPVISEDDAFEQMKKLTQQVKVYNPANEKDFDIIRLESVIFEKLKAKINTSSGYFIDSISYKKFVLFSKRCLMDTLAEILKDKEDIEKKTNFFIRYYRNHENENKRYIWYVGVEKGFYESLFKIAQNRTQTPQTIGFVPFEAKMAFGLNYEQLEKMKESSFLAEYKVFMTQQKVKKDKQ